MALAEGCGGTYVGVFLSQDGVEGHAAVHGIHAVSGAQRVAVDVFFSFQKRAHRPVTLADEEMGGTHGNGLAIARQRNAAHETACARRFEVRSVHAVYRLICV
eukprot:418243-Pleurochrysis_carterae.AAC.1